MPTGMWGRCTVAEPDLTAGGRTCFSWESRAAGRRSPVGRSDDSAHAIVWHVLPELAPLMLLLPNLRLKLTGLLLKESGVASRRRARRPQLKRDPLDSAEGHCHSMGYSVGIVLERDFGSDLLTLANR